MRARALSEVAVLELEEPGSNAREKLSAEIRAAIAEDRCEAIVLGCAGMADLALSLSEEHGLPVVDGAAAAVKLCEGLFALGLADVETRRLCLAAGEALHRGFFRVRAGLTPAAVLSFSSELYGPETWVTGVRGHG